MTVRITVDPDACQGYGQCCFEAEDIFLLGPEPPVRAIAEVDEGRRADAERAADVCPMQAITVE